MRSDNTALFIGRLCQDLELKQTKNGKAVGNFTLAVDRRQKDSEGKKETDFINCVIWDKNAENASKYVGKGSLVSIAGEIRTRKYTDKDGVNRSTWDLQVSDIKYLDSKPPANALQQQNDNDGFAELGPDDNFPF